MRTGALLRIRSLARYINKCSRISLFKAVIGLHALGISHDDLEPRNVTRHSDGTFKIIDFTQSHLHRSTGVQDFQG